MQILVSMLMVRVDSIKEEVMAHQVIASGKALEKPDCYRVPNESGIFSTNFGAEGAWSRADGAGGSPALARPILGRVQKITRIWSCPSKSKRLALVWGISNLNVDIVQQAQTYEANGQWWFRFWQMRFFFKGHFGLSGKISSRSKHSTQQDFIIDEKQIIRLGMQGRQSSLIVAALSEKNASKELYDCGGFVWKSWWRLTIWKLN